MTLAELVQQVEGNLKNEKHRNYQETIYWLNQWKLLTLALVNEIKAQYSRAGSVKTEKKARSSRENGKKGGRPRKTSPETRQKMKDAWARRKARENKGDEKPKYELEEP